MDLPSGRLIWRLRGHWNIGLWSGAEPSLCRRVDLEDISIATDAIEMESEGHK